MTYKTRIDCDDGMNVEVARHGDDSYGLSIGGRSGYANLPGLNAKALVAIADACYQMVNREPPAVVLAPEPAPVPPPPPAPELYGVVPDQVCQLLNMKADLDKALAEFEVRWDFVDAARPTLKYEGITAEVRAFETAYVWKVDDDKDGPLQGFATTQSGACVAVANVVVALLRERVQDAQRRLK